MAVREVAEGWWSTPAIRLTQAVPKPFVSRAVTAPLPAPRPLDVASADVVSSPVLITAFVRGAVLAMALAVSVWALGLLPAGLTSRPSSLLG